MKGMKKNMNSRQKGEPPKKIQNTISVGICALCVIRSINLVYKLRVHCKTVGALVFELNLQNNLQLKFGETPVFMLVSRMLGTSPFPNYQLTFSSVYILY